MAALTSSGESIISSSLSVSTPQISDIHDYFEIERTRREIVEGGYRRVALQFPDELLGYSVPVAKALRRGTGEEGGKVEVYILADTSYGNCCVDEVAASHVDADFIVHYGYACLSKTARLPVLYVFGKAEVDVEDCKWGQGRRRKHREKELEEALGMAVGRSVTTTLGDGPQTIVYVGPQTLRLTNLLLTRSTSTVVSYDPTSKTTALESVQSNRLLMRRYYTLLKARDASTFGILVGTLGVSQYLPLISHLRSLLRRNGRKSYTISVGKLNPSKLANFLEVECFVLVACPENKVADAKEFLRPIITPFEPEVALSKEVRWDGTYKLDFASILPSSPPSPGSTPLSSSATNEVEGEGGEEEEEEEEDPDTPHFSLVSGKLVNSRLYPASSSSSSHQPSSTNGELVQTNPSALQVLPNSAAAHFLTTSRTYTGLELRLGQDEPSVLEQGRSGIARGYQTDVGVGGGGHSEQDGQGGEGGGRQVDIESLPQRLQEKVSLTEEPESTVAQGEKGEGQDWWWGGYSDFSVTYYGISMYMSQGI
ncbi:diphthamide biosynthesis protein 2 [Coprinopsis cinerea okayama7|uniref:2-(3-amino-3-carboxypropyl)histidine synthase subunit 2 n=1 Tax=Coprinopsis cinerea (strain Okayama-7 / 130 / ATCC MYA-4618 / FGSC 9003) TaxID=240176 RepID=A8PBU4_COPC7|nr:diphthamide biosynthesis protein 2 [Coprinopsis cinerea okayama7\|eukprot:XP_001840272.2 diphthamide biosynthesis protein 2 [Coprinopsis cinerea okayama7\